MVNINLFPKRTISIFFPFILILFALLNACTTTTKKDGPPPFYVDETRIPNAVPKVEALSRIGNKPSYVVFGRRYHVLSSSRNYHATGIASWYGTKFHARHTSNGERYDMLAMTAAHKSLPLPTYVKVTNLKNGKQVIVKVNDRGPFESNRLIDLSYVAAKKLGMIGHGTAPVEVRAINPRNYDDDNYQFAANKHTPKVLASHHQTYYLQVGAFRNLSRAEHLKNRLGRKFSSPVQVTKKKLYHVKIGPIRDVASAEKITQQLKREGLSVY